MNKTEIKKTEIKKTGMKILGSVLDQRVSKGDKLWPPLCEGLIYQPKRPKRSK